MWIKDQPIVRATHGAQTYGFPIGANPHTTAPSGILGTVNYAQLLLPDFTLILFGYLVCRYTALNRSVWQPVESLVYYLLFPVLLFQSIVTIQPVSIL